MCFVRNLLRTLAGVLAAACVVQPIALDACHAVCDAANTARVATAPPCHDVGRPGPQISQNARPCTQDHAVMPVDPGPGSAPKTQTMLSTAPAVVPFAAFPVDDAAAIPSPPGSPPILDSVSPNTPLRV